MISIVAVLIALLLPALGSARDAALRATCASRHRQLLIGVHAYATDHNSHLPPIADLAGSPTNSMTWRLHEDSFGPSARASGLGLLYDQGYVPMGQFELVHCTDVDIASSVSPNRSQSGLNKQNATKLGPAGWHQFVGTTIQYHHDRGMLCEVPRSQWARGVQGECSQTASPVGSWR